MAVDTQQPDKFIQTCKEVCCEERTGDKGIDLPSRTFPAEIKMLETPETEEVDFISGKAVLREVPQRKEKGARKLKAQEHIIVGWNFWVGEWLKQLLELKPVSSCYLTFPSPAERWVSWYFTSQFYLLPYNNCCWHIFFFHILFRYPLLGSQWLVALFGLVTNLSSQPRLRGFFMSPVPLLSHTSDIHVPEPLENPSDLPKASAGDILVHRL